MAHIAIRGEDTIAQLYRGSDSVFKAGCKLRVLAGGTSERDHTLDNLYHTIQEFWFIRLPFAIIFAPEYFQKKISELLSGLEGLVCLINDILVFRKMEAEHNQRLTAVFDRIAAAGLILN